MDELAEGLDGADHARHGVRPTAGGAMVSKCENGRFRPSFRENGALVTITAAPRPIFVAAFLLRSEASPTIFWSRMNAREQLLLKQYECLRKEIEGKIQIGEQNVIYGIGATAATWAWFLAHQSSALPAAAYLLPFVIGVLFFVRSLELSRSITSIGRHLAKTEADQNLGDLGWETTLAKARGENKSKDSGTSVCAQCTEQPAATALPGPGWHRWFWGALLLFNLVGAIFFVFFQGVATAKP